MPVRDLLIVGAGPSGLAAAIAAKQRHLDYHVLEQGVLVNSLFRFPPQMVFFTTPELMEVGRLPFVSPYDKPTRAEALTYYRKVADAYDLRIAMDEKVLAISRETEEGAAVFGAETSSARGVRRVRHARFVILAIGYYDRPVRLGVPGEDLPHVFHYQREPHACYRQRVVVVGGGNSAAEAALELFRAGAHVTLVHRHAALKSTIKYWVRPDIENRIREGSIAARFNTVVQEIRPTSVVVTDTRGRESTLEAEGRMAQRDIERGWGPASSKERESTLEAEGRMAQRDIERGWGPAHGQPERESLRSSARDSEGGGTGERGWGPASSEDEELPADAVFLLTGYRADTDLMVRAGVELTAREAPRCDPMTFETNVPGLFVAGGAIAGVDTGTVFIENGRFHGERIVEVIASRLERAASLP